MFDRKEKDSKCYIGSKVPHMSVRLSRGLYSLFLLLFPLVSRTAFLPGRFFKLQETLSTVILSIIPIAEGAGLGRKDICRDCG